MWMFLTGVRKAHCLIISDISMEKICLCACVCISRPQSYTRSSREYRAQDLSDFIITISNISYPVQASQFSDPSFVRCGQYVGYPHLPTLMGRVTCSPGPIWGRFVYVSKPQVSGMSFCEAKVYGVYTLAGSSCV